MTKTAQQTYDEQQTRACEALRIYLESIISAAQDGLNMIGTDGLSDLLIEHIRADVQRALNVNADLLTDNVTGY